MTGFFISCLSAAAIFLAAGFGLLTFAESDPSTADLDRDLEGLRAQIVLVGAESEKYDGGLIKNLIDLRREILRTTQAMLEQKRASVLRRVDLRFDVRASVPAAQVSRLEKIEQELDRSKSKLASAEAEAARYSGGLLQSLALVRAATERVSISQLELAYLAEKYATGLPALALPRLDARSDPGNLGAVVKDRDAF